MQQYQNKKKIKHADIWDCASPHYGNHLCLEDDESTAYTPRNGNGGHFIYPNPHALDHPPVAVVIPPTIQSYRFGIQAARAESPHLQSYHSSVNAAAAKQKRGTFATEITVGTQQDHGLSAELSDEDDSHQSCCSGRRRFWLWITALVVLAAGTFSIGLGVGFGVRGKNNNSIQSNGRGSGASNNAESSRNTTDILVGAYYYPWHGSNFHNGDGYVRSQLEPPHYPTLGEYDDTKPDTISQHLKWSRQANIGLWVTSWWGPNRLEDNTTKDIIMEHKELGNMKIAIHYETTNRVRDGSIENVESDMTYICENYFDHEGYYKINDRPVIFIYVSRKLERLGHLEQTILLMRSTANRCGQNLFIVGDHVFNEAPVGEDGAPIKAFFYFDAVTNYDMYGSMGEKEYHAGSTVVTDYYSDQKGWKDSAAAQGCRYMPTVSPGYNDRGVRLQADHQPLSRRLTADSAEGSLFAMAIEHARRLVDPTVDNLLLVNSFNEWHEDTQIEPTGESPGTSLPDILTMGVEYEGYGELYLDILREGTQPRDASDEDNIFQEGGSRFFRSL
jgi:glycoprotein endo-alpha-1,2-mannosidase